MKILTFGSCLAKYTAKTYIGLINRNARLAGVVQHNRIDQFVKTYITHEIMEMPIKFINSIYKNQNKLIIDNQKITHTLGKDPLCEHDGFMDALEYDNIDLIIIDNFIDLAAKLIYTKNRKFSIFANTKECTDLDLLNLYLEPNFLDLNQLYAEYCEKLLYFLRRKQPKAKIVFINFPYEHHHSKNIVNRCIETESISQNLKFDLNIKLFPINECDLADGRSHFKLRIYQYYASLVHTFLEYGETVRHDDNFQKIESRHQDLSKLDKATSRSKELKKRYKVCLKNNIWSRESNNVKHYSNYVDGLIISNAISHGGRVAYIQIDSNEISSQKDIKKIIFSAEIKSPNETQVSLVIGRETVEKGHVLRSRKITLTSEFQNYKLIINSDESIDIAKKIAIFGRITLLDDSKSSETYIKNIKLDYLYA